VVDAGSVTGATVVATGTVARGLVVTTASVVLGAGFVVELVVVVVDFLEEPQAAMSSTATNTPIRRMILPLLPPVCIRA